MNPLSWLQDYVKDESIKNRQEDVSKPGEYNASGFDKFVGGLVGVDVEGAVDTRTKNEGIKKVDDFLTQQGLTRGDLGLTGDATLQQAGSAFRTYKEKKDKDDVQDQRDFTTSQTELSQKPVLEQLKETAKTNAGQLELSRQTLKQQGEKADKQLQLTIQQGNQQMQLATAQLAQGNNQFLAQMADTKDQRAAELEIRKMEMDREDARYNESLDRQESRDRKQNIAALVQGIASLGAAFAM